MKGLTNTKPIIYLNVLILSTVDCEKGFNFFLTMASQKLTALHYLGTSKLGLVRPYRPCTLKFLVNSAANNHGDINGSLECLERRPS